MEGTEGESVTGGGFFPAATIGTGRLAAVSTGGLRFEFEFEVEMGRMLGPEDAGMTGIAGMGGGTGMVGVEDDGCELYGGGRMVSVCSNGESRRSSAP